MALTDKDKLLAIKMSQCLQQYFDQCEEGTVLRSPQAFEILIKKKLVKADLPQGLRLRHFLYKLVKYQAMDLIPQCRYQRVSRRFIHWYFTSSPRKTISNKNLRRIKGVGYFPATIF